MQQRGPMEKQDSKELNKKFRHYLSRRIDDSTTDSKGRVRYFSVYTILDSRLDEEFKGEDVEISKDLLINEKPFSRFLKEAFCSTMEVTSLTLLSRYYSSSTKDNVKIILKQTIEMLEKEGITPTITIRSSLERNKYYEENDFLTFKSVVTICGVVEESDEDFEKRLESNRKKIENNKKSSKLAKERARNRDLETLERLKKKYDK